MKTSTKISLKKKASERCEILTKHVFSKFYSQKDMTLEKAKNTIRPYLGVIKAQSKWLATVDYYGSDLRSPLDTYGYESEKSIIDNLFYISDRYNCQFRLDWTVGILNENLNKL